MTQAPLATAKPTCFLPYMDPATGDRGVQLGFPRPKGKGLLSRVYLSPSQSPAEHVWENPTARIPPGRLPRPIWAFSPTTSGWLVLSAAQGKPIEPGSYEAGTEDFPWQPRAQGRRKISFAGREIGVFEADAHLQNVHIHAPRGLHAEHIAQIIAVRENQ